VCIAVPLLKLVPERNLLESPLASCQWVLEVMGERAVCLPRSAGWHGIPAIMLIIRKIAAKIYFLIIDAFRFAIN
jgi:hypothetical protein